MARRHVLGGRLGSSIVLLSHMAELYKSYDRPSSFPLPGPTQQLDTGFRAQLGWAHVSRQNKNRHAAHDVSTMKWTDPYSTYRIRETPLSRRGPKFFGGQKFVA